MPASPFPIQTDDPNEMLTQMQSLLDDLYQNRLGGANVGDVFQIGSDDVFTLRYLAIGGLQKVFGSLSILPNTSKGIDSDRNGVFVVLKADTGLAFDGANGIYVKLKTDNGLAVDTDGLYVKLKTAGGITVDADGLSVTTAPPSKAAGTDIDTGTDDAKYITSKAINDSHNVPDVAPGTSGNLMVSNGTDWTSATGISTSTWTPVYTCQTGTFATMTMDVVQATYYKIGQLVFVNCYIRTDNVDTTGASGGVYISGLPFQPSKFAVLNVAYVRNWAGQHPLVGVTSSTVSPVISLRYRDAVDGADSITQVTDMTNGASANQNVIMISGCYMTS